jgi:anti-sigma B factor antagonist
MTAVVAQPQDTSLRRSARIMTMALEGEIGEAELAEISDELFRHVNTGCYRYILDFSDVTHFDYRGVEPLLARAMLLRKVGGDVKLAGLSPYVMAIFRSVGAHDRFDYFSNVAQAREVFQLSFGWSRVADL